MNRLPNKLENDIGLNYTPILMQQPLSPQFKRQRRFHENSPDCSHLSPMRSLPIDPELMACFKKPTTFQHERHEENDNSEEQCSGHCHKHQDEEEIETDNSDISGTNKPIFKRFHISYNGNYEGDVSMFANQKSSTPNSFNRFCSFQRGHNQQDNHEHNEDSTDSDHDVCRKFSSVVITEMTPVQNPILVALQRAADSIFTQNQKKQLKIISNLIYQSIVFKLIFLVLSKFCVLLIIALLSLWKTVVFLNKFMDNVRIKHYLRFHTRRTLWYVTRFKRNDTLLFGSLLFVAPWLFFINVIGFIFSLYNDIKRLLFLVLHFMKWRLV